MKSSHTIGLTTLIAALGLLFSSCEQKSSTGPAPGGPTGSLGGISLVADNSELFYIPGSPISTTITATVTDTSGAGFPNVKVSFSASLGSIETPTDSTDEFGNLQVTFTYPALQAIATQSLIRATVTVGSVTKKDSIYIALYPLTGAAASISLSLNPDELYLAPNQSGTVGVNVLVYDSLGVGIPGMQVSLSTTLGVITLATTTNQAGQVTTSINTNQTFGMGLVTAAVNTIGPPDTSSALPPGPLSPTFKKGLFGPKVDSQTGQGFMPVQPPKADDLITISDVDTFWIFPIDQQIANVMITAYPTNIYVAPDTLGTAGVTAVVLDNNNNGVSGVPVAFATNLGSLDISGNTTNSAGMLTVTFNSIPNIFGTAKVWAVVGSMSDTVDINVIPTQAGNGTLQVYTTTNVIYADGGMTYAVITALLKDNDNQVIAGVPVVFTSNYGTINSPVTTDSTGQAQATFHGIQGFPSFPDSATIIAKYTPLTIADTVRVMIMPPRNVDHIDLNVANDIMTANGFDSTRLDAIVYLEANALASPGLTVNFNLSGTSSGHFSAPFAQVSQNGTATLYYFAGNETGVDTITAEAEGILSNPVPIDLVAGPPAQVDLSVDPAVLYVNTLDIATVTATVRDTSGNLVENNWGVLFSTSLGSISPQQAPTLNGIATSYLSPSTNAGGAWVKAQVGMIIDSTLVEFLPSDPNQLGLSAESPTIQVAGTGGDYQTEIYANVRDASGNLVGNDVMVHFKIQNGGFPGGGVNINNHGLEDSAMTNGGIATRVLNAGTNSGPVSIRAWTYDEDGNEISAQGPLVTIVAGPPNYISVEIGDEIEDGGGDIWLAEVSAIVKDTYGNEVVNGTAVHFYLTDADTLGIEVIGEGYTGNLNAQGDSLQGVAYSTLIYHAWNTFDSIYVHCYCVVNDTTIEDSTNWTCPLADGELTLVVDPEAWNYDHPPPGFQTTSPATMECIAWLVDGHGQYINNAKVMFFSTRGNFYYQAQMQPQYFASNSMGITGPNGYQYEMIGADGFVTLWLLTQELQAFSDPGAIETTAQVHCQVLGTNVASDPITVTYQRDAQ